MTKITEIINNLVHLLTPFYKDKRIAYNNAWDLLEYLTHQDRSVLIAHTEYQLSPAQHEQLNTWIQEITQQAKPIQYILGTVPFLDLTLAVEPPILIPRPETEEWTARLLVMLTEKNLETLTILDLCTGSGCIALALAYALPKSTIVATDISDHALALARKNAQRNKITNITFIKSDLFKELKNMHFDLIVGNPPYVSEQEFTHLEPTVKQWEDTDALVAQHEGLAIIQNIIAQARTFLKQPPAKIAQLWLEIGYKQGPAVTLLLENAGYRTKIYKDLYGNDRVATGLLEDW